MKRIILIFWIALASSGWLMANHWTPNSMPYEANMSLTGIVRIDGIEQQTSVLEVGAFCGDECRGSAQLTYFSPTQHYVLQILIYGNSGDSITFSLYDHGQNVELDLISYDVVTITNDGYGSLVNPYLLNFYSLPPGPHVVTVSADPEVGGTVAGGGTYEHGITVTLTATANEDYRFVNWTKDGEEVSSSATYSFIVTEPGDYIAHFELSLTHHWIPDAMLYEDNMTFTGVIQINGQEQQNPMLEVGVFCGEECRGSGTTTYFAPMQRYVVQILIYGESGDQLTFRLYDHEFNVEFELFATHAATFTTAGCGSLANPRILNFTETATTMHDITAIVNFEGSGTVLGTGTYLNGTTCTLTATANDNYQFINWTENGTMVSTSSSYVFEVTSARNLMANFVPIEDNHWIPNAAPYGDNMTLTGIVQVNLVEQQTTALEVGAFCGEECRGAGRLAFFPPTQRYVIQLIVYGNEGDQLIFKLFDHGMNEELDLVSLDSVAFMSDGYGSLQNPYVLNFELNTITQTSTFSQGYNWWSTYIEQEGINGLEMLENSLGGNGVAIRSQASGYTDYYGEDYGWWGSLTSINNESSYRVVASTPCTVTMTGTEAVPSQHPITLNHGWTWMGYVPSTAMDVNTAMAGMEASDGDMLKSQQGYADYYPNYGWYGSLNTIEPGMGLMYYSANSETVTFTYPNNSRGGELKANLTAENNHWKPNTFAYPDNMTVMAVVELEGAEITSDNYELAAFTANGECRGSVKLAYAEPLHRYVAFLTVSGKDAADLSFRLYDSETGKEYDAAEESLSFVANAIVGRADDLYTIHFRGMTGMDELANRVKVYPNPVNRGEQFSIGLADTEACLIRLEIVDALGAIVSTVTSTKLPASLVAPEATGVYTIKILVDNKAVYCRKLVVS